MEKLKDLISALPKKLGKIYKKTNTLGVIVCTYMITLFVIVFSLYALCAFDFANGKAVFANLVILLDKCTSVTFVAAIAFLGNCFVDEDGDGVANAFDKHHDGAERSSEPRREEKKRNE